MAHEYTATVRWTRDGAAFSDNRYSRGHNWAFDCGIEVLASASPSVVPLPLSREDAVDPEEAFVAAASSCHMLTFLSIAAKKRFVVDSYVDKAVGVMTKNEKGKLCAGHLKRWYGYGEEIKKQFGANAEIYRCEYCHTIYLPAPGYAARTGTLQF